MKPAFDTTIESSININSEFLKQSFETIAIETNDRQHTWYSCSNCPAHWLPPLKWLSCRNDSRVWHSVQTFEDKKRIQPQIQLSTTWCWNRSAETNEFEVKTRKVNMACKRPTCSSPLGSWGYKINLHLVTTQLRNSPPKLDSKNSDRNTWSGDNMNSIRNVKSYSVMDMIKTLIASRKTIQLLLYAHQKQMSSQ